MPQSHEECFAFLVSNGEVLLSQSSVKAHSKRTRASRTKRHRTTANFLMDRGIARSVSVVCSNLIEKGNGFRTGVSVCRCNGPRDISAYPDGRAIYDPFSNAIDCSFLRCRLYFKACLALSVYASGRQLIFTALLVVFVRARVLALFHLCASGCL